MIWKRFFYRPYGQCGLSNRNVLWASLPSWLHHYYICAGGRRDLIKSGLVIPSEKKRNEVKFFEVRNLISKETFKSFRRFEVFQSPLVPLLQGGGVRISMFCANIFLISFLNFFKHISLRCTTSFPLEPLSLFEYFPHKGKEKENLFFGV